MDIQDVFYDGICLFCMKKAKDHWSCHGRSFDGYDCDCDGMKNMMRAMQSFDETMKPAVENRKKMLLKNKRQELEREKKRIDKELADIYRNRAKGNCLWYGIAIEEGKVSKGGVNKRPTSLPPPPPKGQNPK